MSVQSASEPASAGVLPVSWADFHALVKGLALAVADYHPEIILGVARGGLFPGTLLACVLQREFYPVGLTRRVNDRVVRPHPMWLIRPPAAIRGLRVLVVDEICVSGETLSLARDEALGRGAADVRCATLYARAAGAGVPDYIGLIAEGLILNPWDREVLRPEGFVFRPEYVAEMTRNNIPLMDALWPGVQPAGLARQV